MHATHRTTTLSSGVTIPHPYPRLSFSKVPTLYLLSLVLSIFQSFGHHGTLFCEAVLPCQPVLPCWSCEVKWLPNGLNPSMYTLCIDGRAYRGLCRNTDVFSYRLKCCVPSWDMEWKGCSGQLFIESSTPAPTEFPKNFTGVCGIQILPHTIPAHPSIPGAWPWQVNIEWLNNFSIYEHLCGGTLINDQWIITASHCLYKLEKKFLRVILGAYDLDHPTSSEITVGISEFFMHPKFQYNNHPEYDIALIKMKHKVDLTWRILPSCLPQIDQSESTDYSDCWITGWGETHGTGNPQILNELKVTMTDLKSCNKSWNGRISKTQLCSGKGLTGACSGDSGGPLVCRRGGKFSLVGIISWGIDVCTLEGFPNVYTRVYLFLSWIHQIITNH